MERYNEIIEKYRGLMDKPSVLLVITEILDNSGKEGARLKEIQNTLKEIGYDYADSVTRAYMNRNVIGLNNKYGHNLWYRKSKGVYISKKFYNI